MPLVPLQPSYPSSMEAMTAASRVVSKMRDKDAVTNEEAVQAGWIVLGFGASMGTGFLFQMVSEDSDQFLERNLSDFAALRVAATAPSSADTTDTAVKAFPWAIIIPIVLQLIQRWLSK